MKVKVELIVEIPEGNFCNPVGQDPCKFFQDRFQGHCTCHMQNFQPTYLGQPNYYFKKDARCLAFKRAD